MKYRSNAGFTLLELMITVVIVGIVAAMAMPRFQIAFERMKFRSESQEMTSMMKLARSMAIADKRQYGVHIDNVGLTVTLFKDMVNTGSSDFVSGDSVIKADTLPPEFNYLYTDCENGVILFQPNGSARFTGSGYITSLASTESLIGIHQTRILASTGRVETEAHYY
ncbi:prepilin-type N-terminal cleavage/methylation domain-containing protein [bacterium]|nr:prepilin-type N-terminal cleavage/methylation domain-containing protein [bacterium]MCB2202354.1 prepilin-type N-terminal cleavage/methylation domain-containing protein [bacterium]